MAAELYIGVLVNFSDMDLGNSNVNLKSFKAITKQSSWTKYPIDVYMLIF